MKRYDALLEELALFVTEESKAAYGKLNEIWSRPKEEKILSGWTQQFTGLSPVEDRVDGVWAHLGEGESGFAREIFFASMTAIRSSRWRGNYPSSPRKKIAGC